MTQGIIYAMLFPKWLMRDDGSSNTLTARPEIGAVSVSRVTMVLMVCAGMLLLGAGVSGFMSDAEVSSARLGSDFNDARYHRFDDYSIERVQQQSRREQIGMEAVAGAGLMILGMVFFTPKRKAPLNGHLNAKIKPMEEPATPVAPPMTARKQPGPLPAEMIQERYASRRRRPRPDSSLHSRPQRGM